MVMGTTGIKDTHTTSLYELVFTAARSVSGQCCEVKQGRAWLVAGWVTRRVGIKPRFYHKAQPGGFYWFCEAGFGGFMGFINLKVNH